MAAVNRTTNKSYFETGDVPTQAEFGDLIDSCYNLVDDGDPKDRANHTGTQALSTISDAGTAAASDIIDDDTMASASATNVPSAESVVAYIASQGGPGLTVPTALDVGGAATFALPAGQAAGKSYIINNTDPAGTSLGGANPIIVNENDVVWVSEGVTSSTDDGSDFQHIDAVDAVQSVTVGSGPAQAGAVSVPVSASGVEGVIDLDNVPQGLDDVLANNQSLTTTRAQDVGANSIVLQNGASTVAQVALSAGSIAATDNVAAMQGAQTGRIAVDGFVDFTTSEPALVAGAIYINTVTGAASGTAGAVVADRLYQVTNDAAGWTERAPAEGWGVYDKATDGSFDYSGSAWVPASSSAAATKIDSSAAAVVETLLASTNTGQIKFFTNIDVTNDATLAVQPGESLNGVADGTFLFSNYAAGTQFRADEVAGGWVVSVVGAPELVGENYYHIQGVLNDFDPAAADTIIDLTSLSSGGSLDFQESDPASWRTSTTELTVPAGADGLYEIHVGIYKPGSPIVGSNSQTGGGSVSGFFRYNSQQFRGSVDEGGGAPEAFQSNYSLQLSEGDTLDFGFVHTAATNEDFYVTVLVAPVKTGEHTVLAGMVTPTPLVYYSDIQGSTSNSAAEVDLGPSFTIPSDGDYEVTVHLSANLDAAGGNSNAYVIATDGSNNNLQGRSWALSASATQDGANNNNCELSSSDVFTLTAGTVVKLRGSTGGTPNHRLEANCRLTVRQLPASQVVMPDAVPVEDISRIVLEPSVAVMPVAGGFIDFNVENHNEGSFTTGPSGGVAGLIAGNTYRIKCQITANMNSASYSCALRDVAAGTNIDNNSFSDSVNSGSNTKTAGIETLYTPPADTEVAVLVTARSTGVPNMSTSSCYLIVEEVSRKTVINTNDVPVTEWTAYTPTVAGMAGGLAGTDPNFGDNAEITAYYKIVGKSLHIKYLAKLLTADTNRSSGTADHYAWSLPPGVTPAPWAVSTYEVSGRDMMVVGHGHAFDSEGTDSQGDGPAFLVSSGVCLMVSDDTSQTSFVDSAYYDAGNSGSPNTSYSFSVEIPLQ